jgi:CBS domain-containing protein
MLVSQILKSKSDDGIVTVAPEASVSEAAKLLGARRIGAVVVSSDGKAARGILSERDIVRELGKSGASCLSARVETIMTSEIVGCSLSDTSESVLAAMTKGRFRHMPVVEGRRDGGPHLHRRRGEGAALGAGDGEVRAGGHDQGVLTRRTPCGRRPSGRGPRDRCRSAPRMPVGSRRGERVANAPRQCLSAPRLTGSTLGRAGSDDDANRALSRDVRSHHAGACRHHQARLPAGRPAGDRRGDQPRQGPAVHAGGARRDGRGGMRQAVGRAPGSRSSCIPSRTS